MRYLNLAEAKKKYLKGENIMAYLRDVQGEAKNTPEIIEMSYDLQAGSYIKYLKENYEKSLAIAAEISDFLTPYVSYKSSVLDLGAGELTTLVPVLHHTKIKPEKVFAVDVSWSRLYRGIREFLSSERYNIPPIMCAVSNMEALPFATKSIDILISNHSFEPNRNNLRPLLVEAFRVASEICIFFEPYYEGNSLEGKKRMDELGYIKNMEEMIKKTGGEIIELAMLKNVHNLLNPTACFIIKPPKFSDPKKFVGNSFSVPGTDWPLETRENYFFSKHSGLVFPIIENIPILRRDLGILSTALYD